MTLPEIFTAEAKAVYKWACRQEEAQKPDLDCWCAICATEIFKRLRSSGFRPTFYEVIYKDFEGHCFVVCNGYVLDVTAAQFGGHKHINVFKLGQKLAWFWKTETDDKEGIRVRSANSVYSIKKLLSGWPMEQNPFKAFNQK